MASSPCNCRSYLTNSSSRYPSSSVPQTPSTELANVDAPPSAFRNIVLHQFLPLPFHKHSSTSPAAPTLLTLKSCTMCPSKRDTCDSSDSDQRFKRLVKNRDSAARSRARKQAYKNELETKLALLMEENSRLKRQVEELQFRFKSSATPSKMRTLYRTSTAPF